MFNEDIDAENPEKTDPKPGFLELSKAEYPELDGLKPGSPVKIRATGVISSEDGDMVKIEKTSCEIETEGVADKEYKQMKGEQETSGSSSEGKSFF